jgi:hypothetical protein
MGTGKETGGNHPRTSTSGGTSAVSTPANNVDGGSGMGDKGFTKGGSKDVESKGQGSGHSYSVNPASSFGNFLGLSQQKMAAGGNAENRLAAAAGTEAPTTSTGEETCATEDHSFMNHKPGCPQTLPGSGILKGVVGS